MNIKVLVQDIFVACVMQNTINWLLYKENKDTHYVNFARSEFLKKGPFFINNSQR